nr:hypothetical protein [Tanacetum cinerariifolium]
MFLGPPKACHVRLAFFGLCQHGIGLSSSPLYFSCLVGHGAHCDNTVQAQRSVGTARLGFCYLSVLPSSFAVARAFATFPCIGSITYIKSVLTQKALKFFCETFHTPDEVHPQLPSPNQTIHEMPTGKIGVYTRFFKSANFWLPISTFLFNVLKHYSIHISRLSVIGEAKVSHFEIMCRVHGFEPTVGLFRCFYVNSKNKGWMSFSKRQGSDAVCYTKPLDEGRPFFWVDAFTCHASFPWHTSKSVSRDAVPKSSEFNVEHYATLVAYLAPFHKIGERQRGKDEPKLLETTVGRVVPLLPVAPARSSGELEASVDKLFDEGGTQAEQGDSVGDGVVKVFGSVIACWSCAPFVTSSVSGTLEREGEGHIDSVTGLNLRTISAPQRPFVPVITAATTVTPTAGSAMVVKEKIVKPFLFFATSASARIYPAMGSFADLSGKDFLVGGIRTVISPDTDLQKVYVPQWSVTNGSRLDDGRVFREMVDGFAPPKFFTSIRGMEHDQLFIDFNVGGARDEEIENLKAQVLLKESEAAEAIRLRVEASQFKERNALDVKVTDLKATVASQERKLTDSNAQLTRIKYHNDDLADQVHTFILRRKPRLTLYLRGREGRVLTDVAAHNPSAEADYVFSLQQLQSVNFPLLAELKANKAASIEALMNILRLEEHLAKILGLNESQPHADQLMVPIHHSSDNIVVGASAVSFALDVSDARVRRIWENINVVPASADITTTLFVTLASTGTVTRLCVDDYGVMGTDDQSAVNENKDANTFPNVDDAELNIPQ